jgi:type I restriction enzyme M protein
VDIAGVDKSTFDLSVKNPSRNDEVQHRSPQVIIKEIAELDAESAAILKKIQALL